MNVAEKKHTRKTPPSIKVNLDKVTIERIIQGPLKATGGRGAASWVRQLIIEKLDEFENERNVHINYEDMNTGGKEK